jgi:NAD(P)-dependent dehydrogenase (short-subunit alcohol dehydrogenase family)
VKAYAIAPGVIDTDMQVEIRSADPEQFSGHENFVRMKEEGALLSPQESASRILAILKLPYNGTVFQDVRDV